MRTFIFSLVLTIFALPMIARGINGNDSIASLRKEVLQLFDIHRSDFPDLETQDVSVGFMINAKKEIIVLNVQGKSATACEYVKKVLNYRKVKYNQTNLLTPYTITIRLVSPKD